MVGKRSEGEVNVKGDIVHFGRSTVFSDQNCAVENGECFTLCSVDVDSFLILS